LEWLVPENIHVPAHNRRHFGILMGRGDFDFRILKGRGVSLPPLPPMLNFLKQLLYNILILLISG